MLSKCANPVCSMPFRRLSEGKLFTVEARQWGRVECFWLCDKCSLSLTFVFNPTKGVMVRSRRAGVAETMSTPTVTREPNTPRVLAGFWDGG